MSTDRYPFRMPWYTIEVQGKLLDRKESQPSSKRLRWPIGRGILPYSALVGWFVTDDQIVRGSEPELVDLGNGFLVRIESSISIPGTFQTMSTDPKAIMNATGIFEQWFFRSRNKRQAWDRFGNEVAL